MRCLVSAFLCVLAAGCAGGGRLARPQGLPSAGARADGESAGGSGTESHVSEASGVVNQDLVNKGYRPVMRGGQLYYCKKDVLTGTHFPTKVCLTEAHILGLEKSAQDELENINRRKGCLGPECN